VDAVMKNVNWEREKHYWFDFAYPIVKCSQIEPCKLLNSDIIPQRNI
jgi:hypothetical protein